MNPGLAQTIGWLILFLLLLLLVWLLRRKSAARQGAPLPLAPLAPLADTAFEDVPPVESAPSAPVISTPSPAAAHAPEAMAQFERRLQDIEVMLRQVAAPSGAPSAPVPPPSLNAEVSRLADDGQPVREIAKRLSLSRAEVELLLALRSARENTVDAPV